MSWSTEQEIIVKGLGDRIRRVRHVVVGDDPADRSNRPGP